MLYCFHVFVLLQNRNGNYDYTFVIIELFFKILSSSSLFPVVLKNIVKPRVIVGNCNHFLSEFE